MVGWWLVGQGGWVCWVVGWLDFVRFSLFVKVCWLVADV